MLVFSLSLQANKDELEALLKSNLSCSNIEDCHHEM